MIGIDQLKAAGKQLPQMQLDDECRQALRDSVLSEVRDSQSRASGSRLPWIAAGVVAVAAAAIFLLTVRGSGTSESADRLAAVVSSEAADFEHTSVAGPSGREEVVRLQAGRLELAVGDRYASDRFRVITPDAEVEGAGTVFEVRVDGEQLSSVVVRSGQVAIRIVDQPPVIVGAGGSWTASVTSAAELDVGAGSESETSDAPAPDTGDANATDASDADQPAAAVAAGPAKATSDQIRVPATSEADPMVRSTANGATDHDGTDVSAADSAEVADDARETPQAEPTPDPADRGGEETTREPSRAEVAFDVGYRAVKRGDYAQAVAELEVAIAAAQHLPLAEDARYWLAVALARAGKNKRATVAMDDFLRRHGRSLRAGEIAVMYGWISVEQGELDRARRLFGRARADAVKRVRDSAMEGLRAVEREQ